jgi:hypothetical protein
MISRRRPLRPSRVSVSCKAAVREKIGLRWKLLAPGDLNWAEPSSRRPTLLAAPVGPRKSLWAGVRLLMLS